MLEQANIRRTVPVPILAGYGTLRLHRCRDGNTLCRNGYRGADPRARAAAGAATPTPDGTGSPGILGADPDSARAPAPRPGASRRNGKPGPSRTPRDSPPAAS